ncbi:hypothetical protein [Faecalibacterium prausnitzii]|uniref:hypothetical protein n=1 Tax=Faecalibacterium prausnitzii TaxID=853 RepID=UPI0032B3EB6E
MMMPANFSAVSENEMTYVMGGSVAEYLAPVMGKKEWSNFSKNLVTIIGNSYLGNFVNNTLGVIFSGTYVPGGVLSNFGSDISGIWNANFDGTDTKSKILSGMAGVLNVGLNIAGNLAAIYNLGFGTVKNGAEKAAITEFSATDLL